MYSKAQRRAPSGEKIASNMTWTQWWKCRSGAKQRSMAGLIRVGSLMYLSMTEKGQRLKDGIKLLCIFSLVVIEQYVYIEYPL
jgi:hypothetical protein